MHISQATDVDAAWHFAQNAKNRPMGDAWTLHYVQTFATVQSGNVIQSGYRLVQGDWEAFVFAFACVIALAWARHRVAY
jgi:uncharacterized membrane protein YoaK (UPF0700 family)